jgi:hypothetical protein
VSAHWSATPPGKVHVSPTEIVGPAPSLAVRQAELVAALVTDAPDPAGFDASRLDATRQALLRKRAGEAARHWPLLAASLGPGWASTFARVHAGHASLGPVRDGREVARAVRGRGELTPAAARELAEADSRQFHDRQGRPRRVSSLLRWFSRR